MMNAKKQPILAILNQAAGGGKGKRLGLKAIAELQKSGLEVEVKLTEAPGHAREIARTGYINGFRHFISLGGDGTHHEIMNGLFPISIEKNEKPTLGFLPFGTGNSFLRDFITKVGKYQAKDYMQAKPYPCDVIKLKHTEGEIYFINLLSIGFVADVCLARNRYFKSLRNFGYVLAVILKTYELRHSNYCLDIDGEKVLLENITFLSFNNSRFTGGNMKMAPNARIDDGLVDVIIVHQTTRFNLLRKFPKIYTGKLMGDKGLEMRQARHIQFHMETKIPVMIDGEVLMIQPLELTVLPKALIVEV